jgi:LPS sulfotransferase NodH
VQGAAVGLEEVFPDFLTLRAQGFAGVSCAKPAVMIAITPRTGSTFLCTALREAGLSFEPTEMFNPRGPAQAERNRRKSAGFAEYIASFAAVPDGHFIFKIGWTDAAPLAAGLTTLFPQLRVIYLDRRDIAAQAVSQYRAEVSRLWHARPGQAEQTFDFTGMFDLARINMIARNMEREKQGWEGWFAANEIAPLRLEYRLLETDVRAAIRRIEDGLHLQLDPGRVLGRGTRKLADAESAEWTERVQRHLLNLS